MERTSKIWTFVLLALAALNLPRVIHGFGDGHALLILSVTVVAFNLTYVAVHWALVEPAMRGWGKSLDSHEATIKKWRESLKRNDPT